jgi:hypothetical protein
MSIRCSGVILAQFSFPAFAGHVFCGAFCAIMLPHPRHAARIKVENKRVVFIVVIFLVEHFVFSALTTLRQLNNLRVYWQNCFLTFEKKSVISGYGKTFRRLDLNVEAFQ